MPVKMLAPRRGVLDLRTVRQVDDRNGHYRTPEHKRWSAAVIFRANGRCDKCLQTGKLLFADHIVELKDDPSMALDMANGQALCGSCHTTKTNYERNKRLALPLPRR
jgi:5-methylcytosine-specific restriction protein A